MSEITRKFNHGTSTITVGRFTYGLERTKVIQYGEGAGLNIGSFCSIAADCKIFLGGEHRTDWITTFPFGHVFCEKLGYEKILGHPASKGNVMIGNDVWIGRGATIMSGVKIGSGAIVAANSHVVSDISPYQIFGGNPAKFLKSRFRPDIVSALLELRWWDLPIAEIMKIKEVLSAAPDLSKLEALLIRYKDIPRLHGILD